MNQYMYHQIGKDRQAEFLRQAQENRQFDKRMRNGTRRIFRMVLTIVAILDGPSQYLRAAFRAVAMNHKASPTNFRTGASG